MLKKLWILTLISNIVIAEEQPKFDADYEVRYPRTYQWNDSRTGTPYLSGRMPYWYEGKITHPNPPCTIVWQRGTIIDDTCEKDTQKAQQYRQNAQNYLIERDEKLKRIKHLNELKEKQLPEKGLTEGELIEVLGEPDKSAEEIIPEGTIKTITYRYSNGYTIVSLFNGIVDDFSVKRNNN